jgi:AraC-like DNA-binding protein
MEVGIDAVNPKWYGALIKECFLHPPSQQGRYDQALAIQYQGVAFERASKAYHWSEHLHERLEILFINKGVYTCELNGHKMELKAGDVLIVDPGDRHADYCRPPLEYYAIWFDIQQVTDGRQIHLLREDLDPTQQKHSLGNNVISNTLNTLFREEQQDRPFSLPLQQALAEEIIWRLLNDLPEDILNPVLVKRTRESELLVRLTRLFEKHLRSTLKVRNIAEALNMSESTLAHACTDLLGVSPAKAFASYRMEKAVHLLRYSTLSVKEISVELGFHDESHFIHSFRRARGTTPGGLRDKERGLAHVRRTDLPSLPAQGRGRVKRQKPHR